MKILNQNSLSQTYINEWHPVPDLDGLNTALGEFLADIAGTPVKALIDFWNWQMSLGTWHSHP